MYFPPNKDLRGGLITWGIMLFLCICAFFHGSRFLQVILLLDLGLYAWIWFGTGYTITDDSLEVKFGPYEKTIPFSKILQIKRTKYHWFCAALSSKDLLEIKFKYGTVSISPVDSSLFVNELKQRCPNAGYVGL
ncbi:MAG: PH domain-containing protein [Thermacetogeniaceae bacterium]|mgnify:CR=1 FL=1|jgi:hypothetical protein|nr:PH domain-containing protein [Thermoanaerobacterales bacterium]HAF17782.1 hypothetical protein [Peptococcaceae bacterium]